MPQELRVVRCFQCLKYQVDIVKKANKWVCKMCGVKQSLARVFFRGTGKDCRSMVQQLSMRNLAMDQQEEEVVQLMLENKIQLPRPPVDAPTSPDATKERTEPIQGPSKWESFLTKEAANDDQDDGLSLASESFESVSSTTFDRERINCAENSLRASAASGWNKNRIHRPELHEDNVKLPWDSEKKSSSISNWNAGSKNWMYNPIGQAGKAKQTTISFQGTEKRWNCSDRDHSMELPSFHRKENSSKRVFPNTTSKFISKTCVDQSSSRSVASISPGIVNPPAMHNKRKHTEFHANTPLMNFGKRTTTESASAPSNSNVSSENVCGKRPQTDTKTTDVSSSKWAKYLQEDDESDENTDNNFLLF
ncbi:MRN complex-interacting protein [Anopheles maculipalpis]|uniref:MRN complex-interacting protein n=1 Tax=Anopheles maculipalpis TaxID=1496333 RepID=UPI00215947A3|nr:MRN complex-interacting protein [Anopheles maculipalpis]